MNERVHCRLGIVAAFALAAFGASSAAVAAPLPLAEESVDISSGELRVRLPRSMRAVALPPPKAEFYRRPADGGGFLLIKAYNPRDIWCERAVAGEWRDNGGNALRLVRVRSLAPEPVDFGERMGRSKVDSLSRERIEERLAEAEASFSADDPAVREAWLKDWRGWADGDFLSRAGIWWYVEFSRGRGVSKRDASRLVADFVKNVRERHTDDPPRPSTGWWETRTPEYVFTTDLDRTEGAAFLEEALRLMKAMRRLYAARVPSAVDVGAGKVRVFSTRPDYRAYRGATGWNETFSSGAWDPGRDELLICADERSLARKTMRHEAFHQYLHYATAGAHQAMWFNEGMACLFENVAQDEKTGEVKITVEGPRADAVAGDPGRHAKAIPRLLQMTPRDFYTGDTGHHYATAWLLALFLDRAPDSNPDFAPYRNVVPRYLERIREGANPIAATQDAWREVSNRDVAADVLRFWKESCAR